MYALLGKRVRGDAQTLAMCEISLRDFLSGRRKKIILAACTSMYVLELFVSVISAEENDPTECYRAIFNDW